MPTPSSQAGHHRHQGFGTANAIIAKRAIIQVQLLTLLIARAYQQVISTISYAERIHVKSLIGINRDLMQCRSFDAAIELVPIQRFYI
jgi:hypothetical protein